MCRLLAYLGAPSFPSEHIERPPRSLIAQSLTASEAKTATQGDGVGLGWYGERPRPGVYRDARPAWSDENLRSLAAQLRCRLFFAHVRAATGTDATRANCHPFAHGRHLFMHNGQIGGYGRIRRRVEALIDDRVYDARLGTSDSEAIFLAAVSQGLDADPVGAFARVLGQVARLQHEHGIRAPLRFAACVSDGDALHAFRWASDGRCPTLYLRRLDDGVLVVSEPYDDDALPRWEAVPPGSHVRVDRSLAVRVRAFPGGPDALLPADPGPGRLLPTDPESDGLAEAVAADAPASALR